MGVFGSAGEVPRRKQGGCTACKQVCKSARARIRCVRVWHRLVCMREHKRDSAGQEGCGGVRDVASVCGAQKVPYTLGRVHKGVRVCERGTVQVREVSWGADRCARAA